MTRQDIMARLTAIDARMAKLRDQRASVQAELAALDLASRIGIVAGVRLRDGGAGTLVSIHGRQCVVETSSGRVAVAVADVAIR
jgi:hypothetical protein